MNLLAIDASTEACSVAIQLGEQTFSEFELCPQSHSIVLLPMVDKLLSKAGCQLSDFEALVFGRGPGSFTGVRIGIGVAQGLAFAADLPTIGVSTMQAMAQQAFEQHQQQSVTVAIDARMSEVYCAGYCVNPSGIMVLEGKEEVMPPELFAARFNEEEVFGVGTGWNAYPNELGKVSRNANDIAVLYPHAEFMLASARRDFIEGKALPAEDAQPVYVRDTVSWKKLPGRE